MAKQRYINTRFWSDNYISDLNPLDRYLFLYFLTNEHTNIAGIYEVPIKTIAFETGIEIEMLKKMIGRLKDKVLYIDGWVWVRNFQKHQSTSSEKVKKGIEDNMLKIPLKVLDIIKAESQKGYPIDTPSRPIIYSNLNSNSNNSEPSSREKSPPKKEESKDIPLLIKAFEKINPSASRFYGNTTQRKACEFLIKTYTFARVLKVIEEALPRTNKMQYFPTITTPVQLQDKWISLESAVAKYQNKKVESKTKYPVI